MENVWLNFAVFAMFAGYVVFELHALKNNFKLYEQTISELKSQESSERMEIEHIRNTMSRLEKQIEDLGMGFKDFQMEMIRLDLQIKHLTGEIKPQVNGRFEELQRESNHLQHKQEFIKIKIEKLDSDIRNRDADLKDLDKDARSLQNVVQNTVEEMEKLVKQVTRMDNQILEISNTVTRLNKEQEVFRDDYTGGRLILNSIKAGLSAVVNKLLEMAGFPLRNHQRQIH